MLALRDYQEECIDTIGDEYDKECYRQVIALPTGTGKTVIFAHIVKENDFNSLILVHRDELLNQAIDKLDLIAPELFGDVGTIKAKLNETNKKVTIASVQSLSRLNRLEQVKDNDYGLIITDEAHHSVAPSYLRIYDKLYHNDDGSQLHLGFTATPNRTDRKGLAKVYQKVTYKKGLLDMIKAGWLCDLKCKMVLTNVSLDGIGFSHGDFKQNELSSVVNTDNRNELIVDAYKEYGDNRLTLAFAVDVAHAKSLSEKFNEEGISSGVVTGETPLENRRDILRKFHEKKITVLCNCMVLTEGYDEPAVDCILLARPTASTTLYIQMIGRGTRTYPGKHDCLILDVADNSTRHNVIQLPNLVGMKRKDFIAGDKSLLESINEVREELKKGIKGQGLTTEEVDLFTASPFVWVSANQRFILAMADAGVIKVVPTKIYNKYAVIHYSKADGSRFLSEKPIDLSWALGIAETKARDIGRNTKLIDKNAEWRLTPASDKQIKILDEYDVDYEDDITKGDAAMLLTALFHSGQARRLV